MMNNSKLKVYLAGSTNLIEYRKYVKNKYKNSEYFEIIDPLDYENEHSHYNKILETDIKLLTFSDVLIADLSLGPSFGTVSEISIMHNHLKKFVFTFNLLEEYKNNAWVLGQSTKIFNSVDECLEYLKENKEKYISDIQKPVASKSVLKRIVMS